MNILEMDLSPEDEKMLRESLQAWQEEKLASLEEAANQKLEERLEELEVANLEYRERLKEEFADKLVSALDEARDEIRTEIIAEVVRSNPEIKILEQIKELVAPTLNEDYFQGIYAHELIALKEENDELKKTLALEEGARVLSELLAPYSKKTQNLVISLVKPGDAETITEQFYDIIENLEAINEEDDEDEDDEDEDEDDEDDDEDEDAKPVKPKKGDFEDDEEGFEKAMKDYEKELKAWEKKQDEDDEDEDEDEEDLAESFIKKGLMGLNEEVADKPNSLKDVIRGLASSK